MEYVTYLSDGAIHVSTDNGVYVYKNSKWYRIELIEIKETDNA